MEENSTIYQELVKAMPIVIGVLIAIFSSVVTLLIGHLLTKKHERNTRFRERIEALVKALYADHAWLNEKRNFMFNKKEHNAQSPIYEAKMILELYFPELKDEIQAVLDAQADIIKFLGDNYVQIMQDENKWVNSYWDSTKHVELNEKYYEASRTTIKKCREILQRHA